MEDAARRIVVIGGGPAAVWAAIEAKKKDSSGTVTLVSDEACEPYEKPPLSKAVLVGKSRPEDAPIAGPGGLAKHGVAARLDTRCTAIDRPERRVVTTDGILPYDSLVLATGSVMRELPVLPTGMPRVHYLRTEAHARAIKADLAGCKRLAVIGAGLIGLEVAASAAELGIDVSVFEVAPRIMARACDEETGSFILAEHHARGVKFKMQTAVTGVVPQPDGSLVLQTTDADTHVCDLVLVGAGVTPDDSLAAAAGLVVRDGIVVDAQCRTSDPRIFAAGDVTRFAPGYVTAQPQGMVRLENWLHAQEHGAVAGRNAAGGNESYAAVPSFWSEQYNLYIQGVGWPDQAAKRVRRPLPGKGTLLLETKADKITYALGINAQRDLAAIRRLIERRIPVDVGALADPAKPFNAMLKMKA
jgi:3-phenylpropionate/trans-cinnamate dioxygenase ferredoxin reductase component